MMWNWRDACRAPGEAEFECWNARLYNGHQFRMSLERHALNCYRNPLAFDPSGWRQNSQRLVRHDLLPTESGTHLASLPGYSTAPQRRPLSPLFDNSELDWHLENGVG